MDWKTIFTTDVLERLGILVGWISGVLALGWNVLSHLQSSRRANALRITARYTQRLSRTVVSVEFSGLERHASYVLIVSSCSPRNVTFAEYFYDPDERHVSAGDQIVLPAQLPMDQDLSDDVARCTFIVNGANPDALLTLTFKVRHRLQSKILARRRLKMHLT